MKKIIREALLQKRELHTTAEEDANRVKEKFLSLPQLKEAKYILLYYPHKNEVNTISIISELLKQDKIVLLPKVQKDTILPIQIKSLNDLKKGYAGIKEPKGETVSPEKIDIIVVPGVAFDKQGYRLGYGKGFYDRFLSNINPLKVGLAYDFQILENLPKEQHDVPLDIIITPSKIITIKEEKKND